MSVRNVVLAQIIRRRGYGYELADRLRTWSQALDLTDAAIYAALRSLLLNDLIVEVERETPDPRRASNVRVIYEATPQGHEHFQRWMAAGARKKPLREELHMQMVVAEPADIPALLEGLDRMEDDCRADLARIIACSLDSQESANARMSEFGAALVQDALISHLQTTMEWAQRSRRALLNRVGDAATGVPGRSRP